MTLFDHILNGNKKYGTCPEDIVRAFYNCEPEVIQSDVILAPAWKPDLFDAYTDNIEPIFTGFHNDWNLSINGKKLTYIQTGIGAPVLMEAVLALGCTPCKRIIFIGSVGGLSPNFNIGDIVIPEYSVSGDGACRYLTDRKPGENDCFGKKYYPDKELFDNAVSKTKNISKANNVNWHIGKNFSIDTIIAQFAHLDEIIAMGCDCIEMESAAFFKASEICGIKACAIYSVSDNTLQKKSLLSGRTENEIEYRKTVRKNVLTKIVLESLELI